MSEETQTPAEVAEAVTTETPVAESTERVAPEGEPAAEAAPETSPEPERPGADAWAKLRRAEAQLRREREEHKSSVRGIEERLAAVEAREAELNERAKKYDLATYGGDPIAMAEALGVDYDDWTRRMLEKPEQRQTNSELEAIKAELAELKAQREEQTKAQEEQAREAAWGRVVSTFEGFIAPPAEGEHSFELLHHEYSADPEFVQNTLREMAQLQPDLTVQQAAEKLEVYYLERTRSRLGLSKVRALLPNGEPKPSSTPQAETGDEAQPNGRTALSHLDSSERSADPVPQKEWHEMTLKERRDWEKASIDRAQRALTERWSSAG